MDTADHIYSSTDRLILVGGGSFNQDDLIRNARNADIIAVDLFLAFSPLGVGNPPMGEHRSRKIT